VGRERSSGSVGGSGSGHRSGIECLRGRDVTAATASTAAAGDAQEGRTPKKFARSEPSLFFHQVSPDSKKARIVSMSIGLTTVTVCKARAVELQVSDAKR
jgi:hypothetical protein